MVKETYLVYFFHFRIGKKKSELREIKWAFQLIVTATVDIETRNWVFLISRPGFFPLLCVWERDCFIPYIRCYQAFENHN